LAFIVFAPRSVALQSYSELGRCFGPYRAELRYVYLKITGPARRPSCSARTRRAGSLAISPSCRSYRGRPFIRSCGIRRRDEAPEIRSEHFVVGNTDMVVAIG